MKKVCSVDGCGKPFLARGLCSKHYQRQRLMHGATFVHDAGERLAMKSTIRANGCIEWTGSVDKDGYGRTAVKARKVYVHRLAWELANGPIPDGLLVCHRCDNPTCINVAHLFLGTPRDNTRDAMQKGRFTPGKYEINRIFGLRIKARTAPRATGIP
jgi:hypothetical protein